MTESLIMKLGPKIPSSASMGLQPETFRFSVEESFHCATLLKFSKMERWFPIQVIFQGFSIHFKQRLTVFEVFTTKTKTPFINTCGMLSNSIFITTEQKEYNFLYSQWVFSMTQFIGVLLLLFILIPCTENHIYIWTVFFNIKTISLIL